MASLDQRGRCTTSAVPLTARTALIEMSSAASSMGDVTTPPFGTAPAVSVTVAAASQDRTAAAQGPTG
jgi:hypothetical protein